MMSDWFRAARTPDGKFVAQTKTLKGWVDIGLPRTNELDAMMDIEIHNSEEGYNE